MNATRKNQPAPAYAQPVTLSQHGRTILLHHGEHILAEIPKTLRRFGMLMMMLTISIPIFFAGLLVVLWHLAK